MKIVSVIATILFIAFCFSFSLRQGKEYNNLYSSSIGEFDNQLHSLLTKIRTADLSIDQNKETVRRLIGSARLKMKGLDFWFRYLEPNVYRKINGPVPVEWEN